MKAQSLGVMSYYQVISRQSREGDFSLLLLICLFGVFCWFCMFVLDFCVLGFVVVVVVFHFFYLLLYFVGVVCLFVFGVFFLHQAFPLHSPHSGSSGTEQQLVLGGLVKVLEVALTMGSQVQSSFHPKSCRLCLTVKVTPDNK